MAVQKIEILGSGAWNGYSCELRYKTLPGCGGALLGEYVDNAAYEQGYYQRPQSRSTPVAGYDEVTLVFTARPRTIRQAVSDGYTQYNPAASTTERSLEVNPNYKTCWNYDLYFYQPLGNTTSPTALPEWYATATDRSDSLATISGKDWKFQWSKTVPPKDAAGEWVLFGLGQMTKPGREAYLYPKLIVTKTQYVKSYTDAEALVQKIGDFQIPAKRYGGPNTLRCWKITNVGISDTKEFFIVTTEYTCADEGWDVDMYPDNPTEG